MDPYQRAAQAAGNEPCWPDCSLCGEQLYGHEGGLPVHPECAETEAEARALFPRERRKAVA